VSGQAIGSAVAVVQAFVVRFLAGSSRFRDEAILVAAKTDPDWVPLMKRAAGIVTDHGGRTSHAAIVSRELGVPAIVGTGSATSRLRSGRDITLSCAEGETGHVYDGRLAFDVADVDVSSVRATRTLVMLNLADPDAAFRWWALPAASCARSSSSRTSSRSIPWR
jgi:pyruvate,water dikinase